MIEYGCIVLRRNGHPVLELEISENCGVHELLSGTEPYPELCGRGRDTGRIELCGRGRDTGRIELCGRGRDTGRLELCGRGHDTGCLELCGGRGDTCYCS